MKVKRLSTKMIISAIACVATIIAVIYTAYLTHRNFKETVISHTQEQLLSTAKTVAMNLEEFIVEHSAVLQVFSANPIFQEEVHNRIIHDKPDNTFCPIKNFYEAHQKDVDAITVLDVKGILLHRHPFIGNRPGMEYTDKPGVEYVIREHKPHISQVFCNNLGNPAISISEPIFYKGEFAGSVRRMIETATLSKRFVEPVKIGNNGYMWMFDDRNVVLSHPRKDFVGMSVLDVIRKMLKVRGELFDEARTKEHIREEHDYFNRVKTEEEGCGIFVNCTTDENDIVAYKRVSFGKATFNLILTLPYPGIAGPIYEHERDIFVIAGLVVLLLGGGGFLFFRSEKRSYELKAERRYLKQIAESAEALRESEEKYKTLVEASITGIFIHQDGKYVFVNDRFAEMHYYTPKELLGKEYLTLIHPEERDEFAQIASARLKGETVPQRYEVRRLRKDGTPIWCEMMATRIEHAGRPAVMGNIIDITERKRAEEALWESEKQRYRDEKRLEILKFANDVALKLMHELRNPLFIIGGFSKRLSSRDYPEDKLKEYATVIFEGSLRLDKVLNEVLAHLKAAAEQV